MNSGMNRGRFGLAIFILLLAGLAAVGAKYAYDDRMKMKESIDMPVVIRVLQGENQVSSMGNGVVYEETGGVLWIATAAHVVGNAQEKQIRIQQGSLDYRCEQSIAFEGADLAFLRCTAGKKRTETGAVYDKAQFDMLEPGDRVWIYGQTDGKVLRLEGSLEDTWIYVEDFAQYMLLARGTLYPGMSGCGLYDGEGNLIGIACGSNEDGEIAAIPLNILQARFEEINPR